MLGNTKRLELLERARDRQRQCDARLTPAERLAIARRLNALAAAARSPLRDAGTDEPPEVWLRLIARLRARP